MDSLLTPILRGLTWIQMWANLNHCKKMTAEPSLLIPRNLAANLVVTVVSFCDKVKILNTSFEFAWSVYLSLNQWLQCWWWKHFHFYFLLFGEYGHSYQFTSIYSACTNIQLISSVQPREHRSQKGKFAYVNPSKPPFKRFWLKLRRPAASWDSNNLNICLLSKTFASMIFWSP